MSLTFGKTRADHFGRIFEKNPRLLTRNPFLNFLRFYKKQHPKYGLNRILEQGSKTWRNLRTQDKQKYTQKQILSNTDDVVQPYFKRTSTSRSHLLPDNRILMDYKKRSLNAAKNIKRSWRNVNRLPRYGKRKPAHLSELPLSPSDQEFDSSFNDATNDDDNNDVESKKHFYFLDFIPFN